VYQGGIYTPGYTSGCVPGRLYTRIYLRVCTREAMLPYVYLRVCTREATLLLAVNTLPCSHHPFHCWVRKAALGP